MKAHLKKLVAKGKTEKAIEQLMALPIKDKRLFDEIILLSGRFAKFRQDQLDAIINQDQLDVEFNRMNQKALNIIERLPATATAKVPYSKGVLAMGVIAIVILIAIVVYFSRSDKETDLNQIPTQEATSKESIVAPATTTHTNFDSTNTKTHVEVKDQAKVGTIVTGDSNKIEIKQDF